MRCRPADRRHLATRLFLSVAMMLCAAGSARAAEVDFDRDIRPILSDNCFYCHGPDGKHRQADLRLDDRDSAVELEAIVPGDIEASSLVQRVFSDDPDEQMPPPETNKHLSDAQKAKLKQWIAEGAKYEAHWAYQPLNRPKPPKVKKSPFVHNPIDAFVLAKLAEHKLKPSKEADRAMLLRRLSLDLVGLPPTPEEISAFVADDSPDAYEKQVDRLLASPHFGERMAMGWLDVVRYADTVGYHGDEPRHIFPYRDWVIDSFNDNKPFDVFTTEQLAGDLLPDATQDQQIASAFNRLNMVTREGGSQPAEYLAKYAADRVRTIGGTWLGTTTGCAECHDHKFDPFTTRDFYSLAAYFSDIREWGVYYDVASSPNPELKGYGVGHPFPPEIEFDSPFMQQWLAKLQGRMTATLAEVDASDEVVKAWVEHSIQELTASKDGWTTLPVIAPAAQAAGKAAAVYTLKSDGSVVPANASSDRFSFAINVPRLSMIRIEMLPDEAHDNNIFQGGKAQAVILTATLRSPDGQTTTLPTHFARADRQRIRFDAGEELVDIHDRWLTEKEDQDKPHTCVWLLEEPRAVEPGSTLTIELSAKTVSRLRVSAAPVQIWDGIEPDSLVQLTTALKAVAGAKASNEQRELTAQAYYLNAAGPSQRANYKSLYREIHECRGGKAKCQVTVAVNPREMRILPRGNWQDKSGDVVLPATPAFLPGLPHEEGQRLTRLDLAEWIVSKQNPLTARVFVNRVWKQFFGTGLAANVDDFGAQGEAPSHPELLDWLAVDFRESPWDVKHLVKTIVMSGTYRQDANLRKELQESDPANRLLASQNPRRLEAEIIRDQALAISGLLNPELGGPSVRPYQPEGYYVNLQWPDRDYITQLDERQYRRGIYMHWQRTFLHPMLANFDAPSREECTASRVISNTPQQALTLLNDPTFVEAARVLAAEALTVSAMDDNARLDRLFQRVLAHTPSDDQRASLLAFLAGERDYFAQHTDEAKRLQTVGMAPAPSKLDPMELAAWTSVCRALLNLHETITRY